MAGTQLCQIHLKSGPRTFRALSLPTLGHQEHPLASPLNPSPEGSPHLRAQTVPRPTRGALSRLPHQEPYTGPRTGSGHT